MHFRLPLLLALVPLVFWMPAPMPGAPGAAAQGPLERDWQARTLFETGDLPAALVKRLKTLSRVRGDGKAPLTVLERRAIGDVARMERVLRAEGYYGATVGHRFDRRQSGLAVIYQISPGPRFTVRDVRFSFVGPSLEDALIARLKQALSLQVDGPLRADHVVAAENTLVSRLGEQGYPLARVTGRDVLVDHAHEHGIVSYRLNSGPRLAFGPVRFTGLESVEADYLTRVIPFEQGALYDRRKVAALKRRLTALNLFRSVLVPPPDPAAGEDADLEAAEPASGDDAMPAPVVVALEEADHRTISVGAGFATGEGFGLTTSWQHRNLLGRGERFRAGLTLSEVEQGLDLALTKPHFLRFDQDLLLELALAREDTNAFEQRAFTAAVGLERRFTPRLKATLSLVGDLEQVDRAEGRREFTTFGVPLSAMYDGTSNLFDPISGVRARLEVRPGLVALDESFLFLKTEATASAYQNLTGDGRLVAAVRGRLGNIFAPRLDRLPEARRFFAGGGGSVRGFRYQGIGPLADDGTPLGGRSVAELGAELRWRIGESYGLVPFVEGGSVQRDRIPSLKDFQWGAGLGLRYYTSFAPIRLDVAVPLSRNEASSDVFFYVSLGQSF
ncbi:autotransporter assembly complex protein TamA [Yunchengibacter salinarum]|uniref:autotransporter assembly complex protein TamA n=1 Tax=Yunchengibacter salinarum TaxID=3133399 RepID=UPI0035B635A9